MSLAYLGPEGTFTHQAALDLAREHDLGGPQDLVEVLRHGALERVLERHDAARDRARRDGRSSSPGRARSSAAWCVNVPTGPRYASVLT